MSRKRPSVYVLQTRQCVFTGRSSSVMVSPISVSVTFLMLATMISDFAGDQLWICSVWV